MNYFMLDGVETKMSEETAQSLRATRDKEELIASISPGEISKTCDRLILNLQDKILDSRYRGLVLAINNKGEVTATCTKSCFIKTGCFYGSLPENQVFPIPITE